MDMYIASKKSFAIMAFPSNDAKNVKDYEAHEYKVFTAFTLSQAYKSSAAVFVQVACKPRYAVTTLKSYKKGGTRTVAVHSSRECRQAVRAGSVSLRGENTQELRNSFDVGLARTVWCPRG